MEYLEDHYDAVETFPIFYGDAAHRKPWGELAWEGKWLSGSINKRIAQLKEHTYSIKPDLVILGQYVRPESWWLKKYCQKTKIPFCTIFLEPLKPGNFILRWVKLQLMKRFLKGCFVVGTMGRLGHRDYGQVFNGPIIDCPYSFDLTDLYKFEISQDSTKKILFLYSGRLVDFRDPMKALNCFYQVYRKYGDKVGFVISGQGPLQVSIQNRIEELGLTNAVEWRNDFKDWYDLRNLYKSADVLLSLGRFNTWSLTVQEAMAAGLGVVATQSTEAASALVIDGYNGYLRQHHDDSGIVQAMCNYAQSSELVRSHGNLNRNIVKAVDLDEVSQRIWTHFASIQRSTA